MDDTQIEMLPMLGEFSSIASQYEHIMFYYESGIQHYHMKTPVAILLRFFYVVLYCDKLDIRLTA